jgi:hypothetical protein
MEQEGRRGTECTLSDLSLSDELSQAAIRYRQTTNMWSGRNIAVFEYESNGVTTRRPFLSARGIGHAERIGAQALEDDGISPAAVKRIYTELEPCAAPGGYCSDFISRTFPEAEVTYSFPYRTPGGATFVDRLRAAVGGYGPGGAHR